MFCIDLLYTVYPGVGKGTGPCPGKFSVPGTEMSREFRVHKSQSLIPDFRIFSPGPVPVLYFRDRDLRDPVPDADAWQYTIHFRDSFLKYIYVLKHC